MKNGVPKCQPGYDVKYAYDKKYGKAITNWEGANQWDIKLQIFYNGPVEADFIVYEDFLYYKEGVYKHLPNATALGGHAVRIIGWGEEKPEARKRYATVPILVGRQFVEL